MCRRPPRTWVELHSYWATNFFYALWICCPCDFSNHSYRAFSSSLWLYAWHLDANHQGSSNHDHSNGSLLLWIAWSEAALFLSVQASFIFSSWYWIPCTLRITLRYWAQISLFLGWPGDQIDQPSGRAFETPCRASIRSCSRLYTSPFFAFDRRVDKSGKIVASRIWDAW